VQVVNSGRLFNAEGAVDGGGGGGSHDRGSGGSGQVYHGIGGI
jgi:hypothetical protein